MIKKSDAWLALACLIVYIGLSLAIYWKMWGGIKWD